MPDDGEPINGMTEVYHVHPADMERARLAQLTAAPHTDLAEALQRVRYANITNRRADAWIQEWLIAYEYRDLPEFKLIMSSLEKSLDISQSINARARDDVRDILIARDTVAMHPDTAREAGRPSQGLRSAHNGGE